MALPRHRCPTCGRSIAVTTRGRLYRHDPPRRDRELKSCRGSLKPVTAPAAQPVLFAVEPPALEERREAGDGEEPPALF